MSGTGESAWRDITQDLSADLERMAILLRGTSAISDPLTGLVSAAYLEMRLMEETARSERMQVPFSLVAISIFGPTSTTAGLSDDLMRDTAALLRSSLRCMDVLARVSRSEFYCLLPEAGAVEAAVVTDRLTSVVAAGSEQLAGARLVAGTATFPTDGVDAAGLIAAARLALLRTRTAGVARRSSSSLSSASAPPALKDQAASLRSAAEAAQQTQQAQQARVKATTQQMQTKATTQSRQRRRSEEEDTSLGQQCLNHSEPAESAIEVPIAVGYVTGSRFPVSYWHGNELASIDAVLEEHQGESETYLLAQTADGIVKLICRGRRWFLSSTADNA